MNKSNSKTIMAARKQSSAESFIESFVTYPLLTLGIFAPVILPVVLAAFFIWNHFDAPNRVITSRENAELFIQGLKGESSVTGCRSSGLCTIEHNGMVQSFYCPNRSRPENPVCVLPVNN